MKTTKLFAAFAAGTISLGGVACSDLLEVQDPQRYTSDDLDNALEAVAAGVEGDLYVTMDQFVIYQALLGDEFQHTGTWAGYDDIDHGRFNYSNHNAEGNMGEMLRTRWFAYDAEERFKRVMGEAEAASSPLTVQVRTVAGMADMLLGMMFCEAPAEPSGPAVGWQEILRQAEREFTEALNMAQALSAEEWILTNYAGRARVRLYLEDYAGAMSDAGQIPDGWVKWAAFSANSGRQDNDVVQLTTVNNNTAAGMREKWWPLYDDATNSLRDPWTDEPDPRLPVFYDGTIAVDGVTEHYSQYKYRTIGDDIAMFDSQEMRLIEAEVLWRDGDLEGALAKLNTLRSAAGLTPHAATTDADLVKQYLLHERLAETFMEGHRVVDLRRLGELRNVFEAMGDPARPPSRPAMFSMDDGEARLNPEIVDDAAQRCLPTT